MVAHATLLWGSKRRMGTAEDLRSRGASIFKCKKPPRLPLLPPPRVGSLFCSAGCISLLLVVCA